VAGNVGKGKVNCSHELVLSLLENAIFPVTRRHWMRKSIYFNQWVDTSGVVSQILSAFHRTNYYHSRTDLGLNIHVVGYYFNDSYSPCVLPKSVGFMHHYRRGQTHAEKQTHEAAIKYKYLSKRMPVFYDGLRLFIGL